MRLTAEMVSESYRRARAIPARGVLWDPSTREACGIGACYVAGVGNTSRLSPEVYRFGDLTVLQAAMWLGLGSLYASGFVKGFDDWPDGTGFKPEHLEEWKEGFRDGLAAAARVFAPLTGPDGGGTMAT